MPETVIDCLYIDGRFQTPAGTDFMDLINPATEEVRGRVHLASAAEAGLAAEAAWRAAAMMAASTLGQREQWLRNLSAAVLAREDELIAADVEEFGIPIRFAPSRVRGAARSFLAAIDDLRALNWSYEAGPAKVVLEARGPSALITPWNSHYTIVCEKMASALAAGCPVVIKPSEYSALQARLLTECFHEAGLPAGAVNVVLGRGGEAGAALIGHPLIPHLSFTGSTRVGRLVASGAAAHFKRYTLEMGGKSPTVILDDADLEKAVPPAVAACFRVNGQICVAGSRLLVPRAWLAKTADLVCRRVADFQKTGPPADPATVIGPLANQVQYERVQAYIQAGLREKAHLSAGGPGRPEGLERGFFVRPTVFTEVDMGMTIAREEIFGPVLCILGYNDEDQAAQMADDTDYGLAAYIFSANPDRAEEFSRRLKAGVVYLNDQLRAEGVPFGGVKHSGFGRERGVWGLLEHLEPKTIIGFNQLSIK